jgi:hypothetical protein
VEQLAVVLPLKPGNAERVAALLAAGPPFDLGATGFERHSVYLTGHFAVFLFEGSTAEDRHGDLLGDFFEPTLQAAFAEWRDVLEGEPHIARHVVAWGGGKTRPAA